MTELSNGLDEDRPVPGRVADWQLDFHPGTSEAAALILSALGAGLGGLLGGAAAAGAPMGAVAGAFGASSLPPRLRRMSRADHYATIEIDAQPGLNGSGFSIEIERVTRGDYEILARAQEICAGTQVPMVAKLKLGWRAAARLGLIPIEAESEGDHLEEVGTFTVTAIAARVDGPQLNLRVSGRDLVTHRLSETRAAASDPYPTYLEAAEAILDQAGLAELVVSHPPVEAAAPAAAPHLSIALDPGRAAIDELREMAAGMEAEANRRGRSAVLLSRGQVHLGTGRPIPPADRPARRLTVAGGLLSVQMTGHRSRDPAFGYVEQLPGASAPTRPPQRRVFRVEMLGAADIHPGDVVRLAPNPADGGAIGPIDPGTVVENPDDDVELYVSGLTHRLAKNEGFVTTLTAVEVDLAAAATDGVWDLRSPGPETGELRVEIEEDDGTAEGALTRAVVEAVESRLRGYAWPTVAEIRDHQGVPPGPGETAQFTSSLIRGTQNMRGPANQITFGEMFRAAQVPSGGVPYVTPFAWGRFGQVLPRYPGMRVMLTHRAGTARDPVDLGAVWHQAGGDDTAGPSKAAPGDWWLSLPAGVTAKHGVTAPPSEPVLPPDDATAANDLINASGERTIEVGKFVIRVGADALQEPGRRPDLPVDGEEELAGAVIIHQRDGGAQIVMDADGNITIRGKQIRFEAEDVNVAVSGAMNVTKTTGGGGA